MKPIVQRIKSLAATERKITAEILECIREIESQKIHLEMGYPSLLEFLVKECGYSETAALRRILGARLLRQMPQIKTELQLGNLNLTQVALVAQGIRQSEKLGKPVSSEQKKEVLSAIQNQRHYETQKTVAQMLELPVLSHERVRPQADESTRLEITLSKEELELLQKAREILGHVNPGMSWKELMLHLAQDLVKRKDPSRQVRTRESQSNSQPKMPCSTNTDSDSAVASTTDPTAHHPEKEAQYSTPPKSISSAHLNAGVRRMIFQRDRSCQWRDTLANRKCESRHLLEVDHIQPRWAGGADEPENLRILCRAHNQLKYQQESGRLTAREIRVAEPLAGGSNPWAKAMGTPKIRDLTYPNVVDSQTYAAEPLATEEAVKQLGTKSYSKEVKKGRLFCWPRKWGENDNEGLPELPISNAPERSADLLSTELLQEDKIFSDILSPVQIKNLLEFHGQIYCSNLLNGGQYFSTPIYPSALERANILFQNPRIAQALGCEFTGEKLCDSQSLSPSDSKNTKEGVK